MEFVISSVTCEVAVICCGAYSGPLNAELPAAAKPVREAMKFSLLAILRAGLFVLFAIKLGAAGRRAGCHHQLANFLALGPTPRLRNVIV